MWGKKGWINPPNFMFEASCNKHDEGYNKGGDSAKRFECDGKFFIMMIKDTFQVEGKLKRTYYQIWALIYFLAVRLCGKKYFNYIN